MLGFQNEIPRILSKCDIYVQPSLWEGLCITVVEAMATGLPIVATKVGGIPESVIDGYNGFLVPSRNPEALADRILKLVENPDIRAQMGERSRKIAEEKYSLDKMFADVERLLSVLIEKKIGLVWKSDMNTWMKSR
jgi:glycosyltransferase involved in cell wall biosynthesis